MSPLDAFTVGIAPEHVPALVAALLLPLIVLAARRVRTPLPAGLGPEPPTSPRPPVTAVNRFAAGLLGVCAAVHLALPLGRYDRPVLTVGFLAFGAGYAWLAMRALEGRAWRLWSALLFGAALIAYAVVSAAGTEQPDQVGIVTVMVELTGLGLCLVPSRATATGDPAGARQPGPRRFARFAGSTATMVAGFLVGALVWGGTLAAHNASNTDGGAAGGLDHQLHSHAQASRAQAGIVTREPTGAEPTIGEQQAAIALAAQVKQATARFLDLDVALAAGYKLPAVREGTAVHLENKAYTSDGRILDPQRPETLVYAISGGRASLLGALFVMERAGEPGPAPGGPTTHWHAHNVCVTVLPVGFGLVSPFGGCPGLSVSITSPEMMHVWIVDNPGGPFADGLDDTWVRAYHAQHGVPYDAR